jgi:predicted phosphoribosyltransferase
MKRRFRDRRQAGRLLAERLADHAGLPRLLVIALPRGGVPVGFEVAEALKAPLDAFVVRKIGVPGYEELAMGAVASGGTRVVNEEVVAALRLTEEQFAAAAEAEVAEVERRERLYRGDRPPVDAHGRNVILVDDGLATGSTMRAAARAVRAQEPESLTVAVPVAAEETCEEIRADVDEIICAFTPEPFLAVGVWYDDFRPTSDDEVRELLARAAQFDRSVH